MLAGSLGSAGAQYYPRRLGPTRRRLQPTHRRHPTTPATTAGHSRPGPRGVSAAGPAVFRAAADADGRWQFHATAAGIRRRRSGSGRRDRLGARPGGAARRRTIGSPDGGCSAAAGRTAGSGSGQELAPQFRRQLVDYTTIEPAGTIIIDTPNTYLYLILGNGKALRYGVGVGREGFTWSGAERISRMKEWPDWFPPKEMIERQPYLPRFMAGGETNPLGARALYLGNTVYRIHGTNQPSTIGTFVSSGCIRLTNTDIEDLFSRVSVGTRVVVLPGAMSGTASSQPPSQIPLTR